MIFDTDVLIWFFRGNRPAAEFIERQTDRTVSIVSVMELYQGARSQEEIRTIRRFFLESSFRVIPLNEAMSHLALTLVEEHARRDGLQMADALIAATARLTATTLATGNIRHFRSVPTLQLKAFRAGR
jgi:predicted nucleic acid-binding protein